MQIQPLCTPDVAVKAQGHTGELVALRCKRWSCPVCHETNRRRVIRQAMQGQPTAMLTLTVRSTDYETPTDAAEELKRGLRALRKRITRRWPSEKLPFIAVFERHKSGYPHLHLLIRARFIPIRWLRTCWEEITGSFMVDVRKIKKSAMAALYVAKYIGKDLSSIAGCKRYWRSHDYAMPEDTTENVERDSRPWSRHEADVRALASAMRALGAEVEIERGERLRWHSPPDKPVTFRDAHILASGWWPTANDARRT